MIYLSIALAPIVIILTYIYIKDKYNKEPLWMLFFSILGGMISIAAVLITAPILADIAVYFIDVETAFYRAFLEAGFLEELFKYLVLIIFIWPSKDFDEEFDGIVYAVYVSMGFALVENIMFVFGYGLSAGVLRAVTAVPAHAIFAISMGYYLGLAKFLPKKRSLYLILAFVSAWLMHGFYDYFIMAGYKWLLLVFIVYLIWMYIFGFKRIKKLVKLKIDPNEIKEEEN
ncbi:MAG: PrsW family intramembrane metalloprotease [Bacteroidales bacterium]|jgi:RsiW-degrading membrane proteinase PrsW (M82 family)|nr:PrsW family glutamic-type intramembrane protease [Bacteroidales bacterium]MCK9499709.1 PrsW family glutamic-type intramembrane protease [Bacteroidales bacterium]MDY0314636.1 PrsW family glutamic-type intramembrane protease [Bacteroidales bacterium]NLB86284.1 PrsW family intramembrane metalloprotease [Bacteroidales bacterium]